MPPFTVLHVCMGNICRSPMAERLLALAVRERLAQAGAATPADELLHSHSAGTGGWHEGEEMNPPAARQVRARGGDDRRVRGPQAALATTSTRPTWCSPPPPTSRSTWWRCARTRPARTFVLGEFGRLLAGGRRGRAARRPRPTPDAVYARGVALVAAVARPRGGDAAPLPGDDLDDPWGRGDQTLQPGRPTRSRRPSPARRAAPALSRCLTALP